ncbi:MAG: hypothetical protein IKL02_09550 [Kiritimatiellae bacterium]|nr:hypothetical protein [Kiritimatiellia bacterium]
MVNLQSYAANDKTMNWCGWRTSNTSTAAADRDLTTFRNWFATDNPYGNGDGYWWNVKNMTSTTGSWVNPDTYGARLLAQWNQGGCAYVDTVVTNVCEIRFGAFNSYNPVLRIDEGGCISNVNIQVGGFQPRDTLDTAGKGARLHINGGELVVGNINIGTDGLTGLNIGQGTSGEGGVYMTGGHLETKAPLSGYSNEVGNRYIRIATKNGGKGCFALTNGTVNTKDIVYAGPLLYNTTPASDARIIMAGGEWTAHRYFVLRNGGSFEMTGGRFDATVMQVYAGATARISGGEMTGAISFYNNSDPTDKSNVLNITNTVVLSGGTLNLTNIVTATGKGWLNAKSPARFVQTGGVHTNVNFWGGSGHSRYEISGGTLYTTGTWIGGNMPFFFRIQGDCEVSGKAWACNDIASNPGNCLIEHVIDGGVVSPMEFRASLRRQAHGHQRLRPLGGVQVVSTNFFPLFRFNRGTTANNRTLKSYDSSALSYGGTPIWGSWPDSTLWTRDPFNTVLPASRDVKTVSSFHDSSTNWGTQDGTYYDTGCTLNTAAEKGALTKAGAELTFEAVPMGYVKWPNRAKGKATSAQVSMKISAPEGGTLADALAKVCDGLEEAGYEDVAADAQADWNVTFTVPGERIPERNPNAALIFDFTETHVPAGGLTVAMTASDLVTVTNALVSGVSCKYDGLPGFMVIFK